MRRLSLWLALLLALACDDRATGRDDDAGARTVARASLLFEPPTIGLGDVTTALFLVTTPPGHRVLPMEPPEVPQVWLLETIADPIEKSRTRWLHRTRVRLRPREAGSYRFPASEVTIESQSGERQTLSLSAREFRVASVLPQFPDRTAPFGMQEPGPPSAAGGALMPALLGAASALLAVAALSTWRRRRAKLSSPRHSEQHPAETLDLHEWSEREISGAFDALERDPRGAANRASRLMRQYVDSRFNMGTAAFSTEELTHVKPPLAAHSHWPEFVRVLHGMDELRWRPPSPARSAREAERVRSALEDVRTFVRGSSSQRDRS